ncbi:MAG: restriction endonuclease [Pseudomonadota bacterium]|nr:restriction endonuclease [Pseudomonadota bacterium]MDP2351603.1 restriction endonuclease [Pseudomonadota bacterium]
MARRKNSSVFEDLFAIAAILPWWVGSILAVVAYAILHRYASVDVPTDVIPGQMGQMVVGQMTKTLAFYGQFVVPLLFLAGAAASFFGRRKREGLVGDVAGDKSGDALRTMNWKDFELLVGEAFRLRGFSVAETGGGGADGGIDLQLKKGSEVFLVQCKQWRAYKVSVSIVRELFGVMASQGATGGFVVTSGVFTADARSFAEGRNK